MKSRHINGGRKGTGTEYYLDKDTQHYLTSPYLPPCPLLLSSRSLQFPTSVSLFLSLSLYPSFSLSLFQLQSNKPSIKFPIKYFCSYFLVASMMAVFLFLALLLGFTGCSSATYCICKDGLPDSTLQKSIDYACGAGADCSAILQNGACYQPNTVKSHCDYAVNSYFQRKGQVAGSCDFAGTATTSATLPSTVVSGCTYPASPSQTGTTATTPTTSTSTAGTPPTTSTGTPTTTTTTGTPTGGVYSGGSGLSPTSSSIPDSAPVTLPRFSLSFILILFISGSLVLWG
ncbi:hypothetical protein Ancab_020872 [Ancistrocladus abbreviatus]